jgi:hypothetical protein
MSSSVTGGDKFGIDIAVVAGYYDLSTANAAPTSFGERATASESHPATERDPTHRVVPKWMAL